MIKEFWQERREEKKLLKQQKKLQKKAPKTKEQIAYKIFGVVFTLFIIFGSLGYACRGGTPDINNYDFSEVLGFDEEIKNALLLDFDKSLILPTGSITDKDFDGVEEKLLASGLDIVTAGQIDLEKLGDVKITSPLDLKERELGAFLKQISQRTESILLDLHISKSDTDFALRTVMQVDLDKIISGGKLPYIYVTTTSRLTIHASELVALNSSIKINNLSADLNDKVLNVINKNINVLGRSFDYFTNDSLTNDLNFFAEIVTADVEIGSDCSIILSPHKF